jgi:hypothetical protein
MVLAISRERHPLATARCAGWCGMTGKIKPPRVMWAVYSPGTDGKLWFEDSDSNKKAAISKSLWHGTSWRSLEKTGWIVVKYVVAP